MTSASPPKLRSAEGAMTRAQRRILSEAVRDGEAEVGGRNMPAVDRLKAAGLVTVRWWIEHGGQQDRWRGTVKPTAAAIRALAPTAESEGERG